MKKILCSVAMILSVMLLLPLAAMKSPAAAENKPAADAAAPVLEASAAGSAELERFRLLDPEKETVTELSAEDYLFGVVAAEMPALYEPEALKAQAVAAYTYACYRKAANTGKEYDVTADPALDQSFITEEKARERWGTNADAYITKIKDAVAAVKGQRITYKKKPVLAVYHAISAGMTEACRNVWGKDLPYLQPVSSAGDRLSPNYISTVTLSVEELSAKLAKDCPLSGEPSAYFGDCTRTKSGYVQEISVCGKKIKGSRIRELLELRSDAFEVTFADQSFTFQVCGYGHGVGMSQVGADYMAKQGSDYKEILTHYYTGCQVG